MNFFWIAPSTALVLLAQRRWRESRAAASRRADVLLSGLSVVRDLSRGASAPGPGASVHEEPLRLSPFLREATGGSLLAAAGGQPGGVPLAPRGRFAGGPRVRVASRTGVVLGAAALRPGPLGLHDLPAASLRDRSDRGLRPGAGGGVARATDRRLVGAAARVRWPTHGAGRGRGCRERRSRSRQGIAYFAAFFRSIDQLSSPQESLSLAASAAGARSMVNTSTGAVTVSFFRGTLRTSLSAILAW